MYPCICLHAKIFKQLTLEMLEHYGFFLSSCYVLNSLVKTFEFHVGHVTNWNQVNFMLFVYLTSKKIMKVNEWNMQCINVMCFKKFITSYIHTI